MKKMNFLKRTVPYILAGSILGGCGNDSKSHLGGIIPITIPTLPSYEPKDYVFEGIINGTYLKFLRDVSDESCSKDYYSRGVKTINDQLEKVVGSKKLASRLLLKEDTNVLIVRYPEEGTEFVFYDNKGAGEDGDRGDLWADSVKKDGKLIECTKKEQKEFANKLIDIYNYKKHQKYQTDKEKEKKKKDIQNKANKIKSAWTAVRKTLK
jgi:hypothetical protein